MKVTLCRGLTVLFTMLASMGTHSSAADTSLGDEPVSDHEDDFVEDSSSYPMLGSQSYLLASDFQNWNG